MTLILSKIFTEKFHPGNPSPLVLAGVFAGVAILGIGQDFINSRVNENAFYLSESSLYKVIWLLFIPLLSLGVFFYKKSLRKIPSRHWASAVIFSLAFSLIHLVFTSLSIHALSALLLDHTYAPHHVFRYFFSEVWYIILLIYSIGFIYSYFTQTQEAAPEEEGNNAPLKIIPIRSNNQTIPVATKDIVFIQSDRPYIAITTKNHRYLHSSSLSKMLKDLDGDHFVRVHRSTIVNINHIAGIKSRHNGDYDLAMNNGASVRLSRNYNQDFRSKVQYFPQLSR